MITFLLDIYEAVRGAGVTPFMAFFLYVWVLWAAKVLLARRYRPFKDGARVWTTSVVVPVYNEPEDVFRRVLESVAANGPTELIAVVDGGDPALARVAGDYCDEVVCIP